MRRPVIGITLELDDHLIEEVERGMRQPLQEKGAMVLAIPRDTPVHEIDFVFDLVDGLVLSGGADVHPDWYGDPVDEKTAAAPAAHDAFEVTIARRALDAGMPILGLCRGAQVLAVADGGALTQDVPTLHPDAGRHAWPWYEIALDPPGDHWHEISVAPESRIADWLGDGPKRVNSFHHQCVREVGSRLQPVAWSLDGAVEATERSDGAGFAIGLQWHNELMWRHDNRFLAPHHELVAAAWEFARTRQGAASVS